MTKISVIIPVYNTGKYIKKCLDSIVNQTYKDLEIIVIDDCSSDNSLEEIEKFRDDERVKIIKNEQNKGVSFCRNKGLEISSGEYISFIDSDDYIDYDTYQMCIETLEKEDVPLIIIGRHAFLENEKIGINFLTTKNVFSSYHGKLDLKNKDKDYIALVAPSVTDKLIKKELLDGLKFPNNLKWEDYPVMFSVLGRANSAFSISKDKYKYRYSLALNNTTSKDLKKTTIKFLDIFDCCDLVEENYRKDGLLDEYLEQVRGSQIVHSLQRVRDILFSLNFSKNDKKELINDFINLIDIKYGNFKEDKFYKLRKEKSIFYRVRMSYVEKYILDDNLREETDCTKVKEKIKSRFSGS